MHDVKKILVMLRYNFESYLLVFPSYYLLDKLVNESLEFFLFIFIYSFSTKLLSFHPNFLLPFCLSKTKSLFFIIISAQLK